MSFFGFSASDNLAPGMGHLVLAPSDILNQLNKNKDLARFALVSGVLLPCA